MKKIIFIPRFWEIKIIIKINKYLFRGPTTNDLHLPYYQLEYHVILWGGKFYVEVDRSSHSLCIMKNKMLQDCNTSVNIFLTVDGSVEIGYCFG